MFCSKCGKEIADDSVFCKECGYKIGDAIEQPQKIRYAQADAPEKSVESAPVRETKTASAEEVHSEKTSKKKSGKKVFLGLLVGVALLAAGFFIFIFSYDYYLKHKDQPDQPRPERTAEEMAKMEEKLRQDDSWRWVPTHNSEVVDDTAAKYILQELSAHTCNLTEKRQVRDDGTLYYGISAQEAYDTVLTMMYAYESLDEAHQKEFARFDELNGLYEELYISLYVHEKGGEPRIILLSSENHQDAGAPDLYNVIVPSGTKSVVDPGQTYLSGFELKENKTLFDTTYEWQAKYDTTSAKYRYDLDLDIYPVIAGLQQGMASMENLDSGRVEVVWKKDGTVTTSAMLDSTGKATIKVSYTSTSPNESFSDLYYVRSSVDLKAAPYYNYDNVEPYKHQLPPNAFSFNEYVDGFYEQWELDRYYDGTRQIDGCEWYFPYRGAYYDVLIKK